MIASSLLLFGPVVPRPKASYVAELQTSLKTNLSLRFLRDATEELPLLWSALQDEIGQLDTLWGKQRLETLVVALSNGSLPDDHEPSNIVSAPLTIISQIAEYLNLSQEGEETALPSLDNVQGCCVGFLTAIVVACSRDKDEFQELAAIAIRLAMCIGAIVDLDEASMHDSRDRNTAVAVRWRTDPGEETFVRVLKDYSTVSLHITSFYSFLVLYFKALAKPKVQRRLRNCLGLCIMSHRQKCCHRHYLHL